MIEHHLDTGMLNVEKTYVLLLNAQAVANHAPRSNKMRRRTLCLGIGLPRYLKNTKMPAATKAHTKVTSMNPNWYLAEIKSS